MAEGVLVGTDDERKVRAARLLLGSTGGLLDAVRAYPSNADAWEALWLSDEATGSLGEQELVELNTAKA
jgi:hypothetical protein